MESQSEQKYLLLRTLQAVEKIGDRKILSLITHFNSYEKLLNASFQAIAGINGISEKSAKNIFTALQGFPKAKEKFLQEIDALKSVGANFVTIFDENYPQQLKNIFLPPLILYYYGELHKQDKNSIAIVGTRKPTNYGKKIAEKLSAELTERGLTIVSGMARGIDSIAHSACLKKGGRTIAVIGSGLDVIYPPENKDLFHEIIANGAVVTEYFLGTKPDAQNFPRRNRIISGLTLGTIIVETAINGGAMHTAAYALDQGREIFAVPGNITSYHSEGCNELIKRGEAKLIQSVEDVLNELPLSLKEKEEARTKQTVQLNIFEEKIYNVLGEETLHIDKISELTGLSISDCLVHLLSLEFKGIVKQYPGKMFGKF